MTDTCGPQLTGGSVRFSDGTLSNGRPLELGLTSRILSARQQRQGPCGVPNDVGAEGGEWQLGEAGLERGFESFAGRGTRDEVEPRVAEQHRRGDGGRRYQPLAGAMCAPGRQRQRRRERDVEPDPCKVVVARHMARRQRVRQVERPGPEPGRHEQQQWCEPAREG